MRQLREDTQIHPATAAGADSPSNEPLALEALHRELLAPRVRAIAASVADSAARAPWLELEAAIDALSIPLALQERIATVIELALSGGRIRREAGPAAEAALAALFRKTSHGLALAARLDSINRALAQLKDSSIDGVRTTMRAPGVYVLTIQTAALQIAIRFDRNGPEVESLEVGLG
ncbi:MAG TPA: hypothetical protein VMD75_06925 [Candidatus Binataceae bacterium]|jgi:hypothetical protein|nr:hypothetical protein [Candidatus Binataceae bacterium]